MERRFKVYDAVEGISCALMAALLETQPGLRFWVSDHANTVFAFGVFVCATTTREEGERIASAMEMVYGNWELPK